MKRTFLLCALPALLVLGAATPFVVAPQDPVKQDAPKQDGEKPSNDEAMDKHMKVINSSYRRLRTFLRKPQGDAPMSSVDAMQVACVAAKMLKPTIFAKVPADRQAEFETEYRKAMNAFLRQMLDLEEAMMAKDWKKAGEHLAALNDAKKTGHKRFKLKVFNW